MAIMAHCCLPPIPNTLSSVLPTGLASHRERPRRAVQKGAAKAGTQGWVVDVVPIGARTWRRSKQASIRPPGGRVPHPPRLAQDSPEINISSLISTPVLQIKKKPGSKNHRSYTDSPPRWRTPKACFFGASSFSRRNGQVVHLGEMTTEPSPPRQSPRTGRLPHRPCGRPRRSSTSG